MGQKIQFTLAFDESLEAYLQSQYPDMIDFHILSESLDARGASLGKKPKIHYQVELGLTNSPLGVSEEKFPNLGPLSGNLPIIIGSGPAGLFCALRLSEYSIPSLILERGVAASERMHHISRYWRYGQLDEDSNVCYGEGGAGLFSDGKLITRIKSSYVDYVMKTFVDLGAPAEIRYLSNPHLGSNKIRQIISSLTQILIKRNCQIRYKTKVTELIFENKKVVGVILASGEKIYSSHVILATGHSAGEIYQHLNTQNVSMKQKDFAVGVRIEHKRRYMDTLQYGNFAQDNKLGAARYRLSYESPQDKKGIYTFCMCPGGHVLSSGTQRDGIVVNGMSNFARNSPWSNSAVVVTIKAGVDFAAKNLLAGLDFQRDIEKKAFKISSKLASGREIPALTVKEFLQKKIQRSMSQLPKSSTPSGIFRANMEEIFPPFVVNHLREGLMKFDQKLPGFSGGESLLLAPETRTSAPVTILRDKETLMSLSHQGLYPCGEGAGYAGGITSAAVDGIKVAMSLIKSEKNFSPHLLPTKSDHDGATDPPWFAD